MTISAAHAEDLYRFIWKEIKNMHSTLLRIGGIQNHVHILIDLNPAVSLSQMIRNIKIHSSGWMCGNEMFPNFEGWAREYYACTVSPKEKDGVIEYIKGQQTHHLVSHFDQELISMYQYAELDMHDNDMMS